MKPRRCELGGVVAGYRCFRRRGGVLQVDEHLLTVQERLQVEWAAQAGGEDAEEFIKAPQAALHGATT